MPPSPDEHHHRLTLRILPYRLAVCTLPAQASPPGWTTSGSFYAVMRTEDELSLVCDYAAVPPDVTYEGPWRCMQVQGPLAFTLTGILASLAVPLADAVISIFALSTFRTDYVLIPERDLQPALDALRAAGHRVS